MNKKPSNFFNKLTEIAGVAGAAVGVTGLVVGFPIAAVIVGSLIGVAIYTLLLFSAPLAWYATGWLVVRLPWAFPLLVDGARLAGIQLDANTFPTLLAFVGTALSIAKHGLIKVGSTKKTDEE